MRGHAGEHDVRGGCPPAAPTGQRAGEAGGQGGAEHGVAGERAVLGRFGVSLAQELVVVLVTDPLYQVGVSLSPQPG